MTEEQIEQKAEEYSDAFIAKGVAKASYIKGYNEATKELNKKLSQAEEDYDKMFWQKNKIISNLREQIEKLIDFVLSKTECCDVCPITDTCINSEGTCPYAGILAKGEEEVTREWLMQFISRRMKNDRRTD